MQISGSFRFFRANPLSIYRRRKTPAQADNDRPGQGHKLDDGWIFLEYSTLLDFYGNISYFIFLEIPVKRLA